MNNEELLSYQEAADLFKRGRTWIYSLRKLGLPTYAGRILECWLDPSHKYVIILDDTMNLNTGMRNYNLVYDFFKQQVD